VSAVVVVDCGIEERKYAEVIKRIKIHMGKEKRGLEITGSAFEYWQSLSMTKSVNQGKSLWCMG
jgi:hypothetical protein